MESINDSESSSSSSISSSSYNKNSLYYTNRKPLDCSDTALDPIRLKCRAYAESVCVAEGQSLRDTVIRVLNLMKLDFNAIIVDDQRGEHIKNYFYK